MVEVKVTERGSVFKPITFLQGFEEVCADLMPRSCRHPEAWFDIHGKYLSQIKFNSAGLLCQPML